MSVFQGVYRSLLCFRLRQATAQARPAPHTFLWQLDSSLFLFFFCLVVVVNLFSRPFFSFLFFSSTPRPFFFFLLTTGSISFSFDYSFWRLKSHSFSSFSRNSLISIFLKNNNISVILNLFHFFVFYTWNSHTSLKFWGDSVECSTGIFLSFIRNFYIFARIILFYFFVGSFGVGDDW